MVEEKILQLLVDLTADVREVKNDVSGLKSDVGSLKNDVGNLKSDVADLKTGLTDLRSEMNDRFHEVDQRFDKVDRTLTGIGGQFEVQTEQRLNDKKEIELEFSAIKVRLFDLETKVNRTH